MMTPTKTALLTDNVSTKNDHQDGSSTTSDGVHLIVLVHGLFGSEANLKSAKEEILRAAGDGGHDSTSTFTEDHDQQQQEHVDSSASTPLLADHRQTAPSSSSSSSQLPVRVLVPTSFPGSMTYDGLEVLAARVCKEIDVEIERIQTEEGLKVVAFSIMGYSLGGLIARYLIALLDTRTPSFFSTIRPLHFSTIATPHLGIPRYGSIMSRITHSVGGWLFSRSGAELFCADRVEGDARGRPLLEVMADPSSPFVHALQSFSSVLIVANGCHDLTVPYPSAAIASFDPFMDYEHTGVNVDTEEDDAHVVRGWSVGVNAQALETKVGELAKRQKITKRAKLPPFLQFRWPYNYLFYAILPILAPLWFGFLTVLMTYQTFQSSRRRRQHRLQQRIVESIPLPVDSDASPASSSTPALLDPAFGTSTSPSSVTPKVPLLLSSAQQRMVTNLNAALPDAKRLVAWFPTAYNSHAVIVVRDPKRFPSHEQGRGVLRKWAEQVVAAR